MTTILITGGAGFVGSNFAIYHKTKHAEDTVICLDNLKRRGSELTLKRLKEHSILFVHGDIRNKEDLKFDKKIDVIIECSAEPSVLAGLNESPEYLINTNLMGAINCFECARLNKSKIIFLSTSRVYPYDSISTLPLIETETRFKLDPKVHIQGLSDKGVSEDFDLKGFRTLYGATKLSAEYLALEYAQTYNIPIIINRCGVIAGPWQMGKVDQGVFTLWVARHYYGGTLQYIGFNGEGKQVRDLMHVDDLSRLLEMQIENFEIGKNKIYNVGGGTKVSLSLKETTLLCEKISGKKIKINPVKENRFADLPIYITDATKVNKDYNWTPEKMPEDILKDIYEWIDANKDSLRGILN